VEQQDSLTTTKSNIRSVQLDNAHLRLKISTYYTADALKPPA